MTSQSVDREYLFLRGRSDSNPGILIWREAFKMKCHKVLKDKETFRYVCQSYQTLGVKCLSKAVVKVHKDLARPQVLSVSEHSCLPNKAMMMAERMRTEKKSKVFENPLRTVQQSIDEVKNKFGNLCSDDDLWDEVIGCLG